MPGCGGTLLQIWRVKALCRWRRRWPGAGSQEGGGYPLDSHTDPPDRMMRRLDVRAAFAKSQERVRPRTTPCDLASPRSWLLLPHSVLPHFGSCEAAVALWLSVAGSGILHSRCEPLRCE